MPSSTDSCSATHTNPPWGGGGVTMFVHWQGPHTESCCKTKLQLAVYGKLSWALLIGLLTFASFLLQCSGTLITQVPQLFLWPWGSWDHTVLCRIHYCFTIWAPIRQGCLSLKQILKGSDFELQGYYQFPIAGKSLPPLIRLSYFIFPSVSLPCTSYLLKSVHFSICRIPNIFFLTIQIEFITVQNDWIII